jgi:hypothetical protein
MSVANILEDPAIGYKKIDQMWYNAGGGPPPVGLYLPLAGGTMDASPAGIINAHTINELTNITGSSIGPGNDTVIQTINGNDLALQTDPNESITANTGQFEIDASIRCEINATTVIQPIGGYTYPNNPEIGLTIQNWNNPIPSVPMTGCLITNTTADFNATGLEVNATTTINNSDATGIKAVATGDISITNQSEGIHIEKVNAVNTAIGANIIDVNANDVVGASVSGINGVNTSVGVFIGSPTSSTGNTDAIIIKAPAAAQDCRGINAGNLQGTNVWGAEFNNLIASGGDARGVVVSGADGSSSTGVGVDINSTTGGPNGAYGIIINGTTSVASGIATGVEIGNTNGDATATGVNASAINSTNGRAEGIITTSINASAAGADANGFRVDSVNSAGGFARGMSITNIDATTNRCFGVDINALTGGGATIGVNANNIITTTANTAAGMNINNVAASTGTGIGVSLNTISGTRANGIDLANVIATNATAHGIRVQSVRTTNVPASAAYGGFFSRGAKLAANAGQLMRIFDGNLGLAVQTVDGANANVFGDGGNMIIITVAAAVGVNLVPPNGGWEAGHWFLFSKQGGGVHNLIDGGGANFNGAVGPFAFGGAGGAMCLLFWTGIPAIGWAANDF